MLKEERVLRAGEMGGGVSRWRSGAITYRDLIYLRQAFSGKGRWHHCI